ncbi:MAG: LacI family DNA-binding transcriptional regulator [Anaerolineales bacterium]|jgi:LacI family transcriptional regulator
MISKRKTTIYEVAQAAGVSRQTVSRVLNDRPDVSSETRKRIKEIIEQLDYQPSAIARSLSLKKTYTFGVVTAGLKYLGPSRTLSGITRQADELGYGLLLKELASFSANNVTPLLQWFQSHHVDGLIWAAPEIGDNRNWLEDPSTEIDVPIIFMTMEKRKTISMVSIDNFSGGKLATEHLIDLGRKNIGHISGPLDWWEARERKRGWEVALSATGHQPDDHMWVEGNWSSKNGKLAINELLNKFPEMDAVFVGNDQMALSVLQTAWEAGVKVPDDLAVIGFDGISEAEYYSPPLSTIYQNQDEVGRTAVQELIRLIDEQLDEEQEITPRQITITPELIIRESTKKI